MNHGCDPLAPSKPGGFLRAVTVLASSTVGAHLISAAAMPLLSRVYGPAAFGTLAVFTGVVSTVAVAACFRYDVAVALPQEEEAGFALLILSLGLAALVALAGLILLALDFGYLSDWLRTSGIGSARWLLPLGIFFSATYSALQNWNIRTKSFGQIGRVRVLQSVAGTTVQLGMGVGGIVPMGLVAGSVASFSIGALLFTEALMRRLRVLASTLSVAGVKAAALEYRRFPAYSTLEALANNAAIHAPILLISALAAPSEAGHIMLAMYAIQAPMALIGSAIGQVYLSEAPDAHRAGKLHAFTIDILGNLVKTGLGPVLAMGILAPHLFQLIFGQQWDRAGLLVAWMTPWFALQFLASPVSMALHITGGQRIALSLQAFSLIVRVSFTLLPLAFGGDWFGEAYAISGAVVYGIYLFTVLKATRYNNLGESTLGLGRRLAWALPWAAIALMIASGIRLLQTRGLLL